ncbi:Low molecular weight protein tyrosine phosphatase (EC 3.1.3.48) [uncultured Gammaproteobacteria bacterium]|nr:Low molecular weight protein tyrosine phosphatase (EC 3.1.3.48) [uncultured Gammaproteobacteria bacterium]
MDKNWILLIIPIYAKVSNIVKRLKELEVKNSRLKKVYADERLMSQIRLEALEGKL